jgi:hypothetical protein
MPESGRGKNTLRHVLNNPVQADTSKDVCVNASAPQLGGERSVEHPDS